MSSMVVFSVWCIAEAAGRSTTTPNSTDDDEPGFKFDRHGFVAGEYVSLKEQDGTMRTFRVIWVRDLD